MTALRSAALLVVLLHGPLSPTRAAGEERATAGGRLVWDFAEPLDLLGDLWVDLPFVSAGSNTLFFALDTRTSIEKARSDFAFQVRDLDYAMGLGWRAPQAWAGGRAVSLFAGQRGKQRVDADGQPWVRYIGLGVESRRGAAGGRLEWSLAGGPVVEEREVEADLVLRGAGRWRLPGGRFALNLEVDGLIDGSRWRGDVVGGPEFLLPIGRSPAGSLFLHYQRSRNPLGIGHSALLAGFSYGESRDAAQRPPKPPEIDGVIAAGAGDDGRLSGRLALRLRFPEFRDRTHIVFDVDANILTARDTGELYYFYHLGVERPVGTSTVGTYFYHRSNHQLAEPNDTVTSLNVLELGIESEEWGRPGRRSMRRAWGAVEARTRIGYLLDGSFGEDRRWHVVGGLRWSVPVAATRLAPYVMLEAEAGDVERRSYALGFSPARRWDVQAEWRDDEQYFARDRTAFLVSANYGF